MSIEADQESAIREILTDVLNQTRPDELVLVQTIDRPFDDREQGGVLAFGTDQAIALLMPSLLGLLLDFAKTVPHKLAEKVGEHLATILLSVKPDREAAAQTDIGALSISFRRALRQRGFQAEDAAKASDCLATTLLSNPVVFRRLLGIR